MQTLNHSYAWRGLRCLAIALAASLLTSSMSLAVPYASQVVKTGNTVTFVLNQNAEGIAVVLDGNTPLTPALTATAGVKTFSMPGYTSYQIVVTGNTAKAWTQFIPDGTDRQFYVPRGLAINKNPASTNFGKVYVSEARGGAVTGGRTTTDGIYVLRADGVAEGGVKTGGVDWVIDGSAGSAPLRSFVGPDDHLYVVSLFTNQVYEFNSEMTVATPLIADSNKTGAESTAQNVHSVWVEGTKLAGDRKIYLVNGNYNDVSRKGLIQYDLAGNDAAALNDQGTQIVGPGAFNYFPYDVARDSSGFWYLNQYRATAGQAFTLQKFDGAIIPNNEPVWTVPKTYTYTESIDINEAAGVVAVGDYSTGLIYFFDMATGAFKESFDCGTRAREQAFDAVGNLVTVDNSAERARFWSPGGYTVATTRSDGTFQLVTPDNLSVTATDPDAAEAGSDTATFTISRSGGNNGARQVHFTLTGTAQNSADYTISAVSPISFNEGETSVAITITPNDDSTRESTETVVLTLVETPDYYVTSQRAASASIVDNDAVVRYRDGNGNIDGAGSDVSGNWTDSSWSTSPEGTTTPGAWTAWAAPVFSAGADAWSYSTITISGTQRMDGPTFEEGYVTLTGGTIVLTNYDSIKVLSGASATIASVVAGVSGLSKGDAGTLTLGGANIYSGPTVVNAGMIQLAAADVIPDGSALVINGGTFDLYSFNETAGSLAGAEGGVLNVPWGYTFVFGGDNTDTLWNGTSTGGGWLAKVGTGTMSMTAGSIAEPLAISNGVVSVNGSARLTSSAANEINIDGGTLRTTIASAAALAPSGRSIILGAKGGVLDVQSASGIATYGDASGGGTIQGGTLIKDGPGELRVNGLAQASSTFEKLVIRQGTYRAGYTSPTQAETFLGATPSEFIPDQITISNGAILANSLNPFEISANRGIVLGAGGGRIRDSMAIPGVISGSKLIKDLAGSLILRGANTYTDGTVLSSGTLFVRNTSGSATGSGSVNVTNATLAGDGILGGPVFMSGGTLAPGYNYTVEYAALTRISNSIATLVLTNGLNMSLGATNSWQLSALTTDNPGTEFDLVSLTGGSLVLGGSSRLVIAFTGSATAPSESEAFWQQSRQWKIISLSGSASNPGNSTFAEIIGTNGITSGRFTTRADATGVTLVFTPSSSVPQPVTQMTIGSVSAGSMNITYSGANGTQFVLLRSPDVEAPVSSWARVQTNTTAAGSFVIPVGSDPKAFYRIQSE